MSQAKVAKRSTAGFILDHPICCLCGERPSTTREHMPPKALFDNKFRPDQLVMPACSECNGGTATADLVVSLISRWGVDESKQSQIDHAKLTTRMKRQAPQIVAEWLSFDTPWQQIQARAHLARQGVYAPSEASMAGIGPYTIRALNIFAHKVALTLYFEHFRKPLPRDGRVQAIWRTKEDFWSEGVPQGLLDLMSRYGKLMQGKWNTRETFEYRYDLHKADGLFGCFVRFRQGLYVLAFAIERSSVLTEAPELGDYWIKPGDLLKDNRHFFKKMG